MRSLIVSLYAGVFFAILTLGWAIDNYYESFLRSNKPPTYPGYQAALSLVAIGASERINNKQALDHFLSAQTLDISLEPLDSIALPEVLSEQLNAGKVIMLESEAGVSLHQLVPSTDWLLNLNIDEPEQILQSNEKFILTLLFYAGIALMLLLWLMPLLYSVQQLSKALKQIGQGDLSARIKNPTGFYLQALKNDFNAMAQQLQRLSENNRLLSQAVSHELRTPLSRLRFALEMMKTQRSPNQLQLDITRAEADIDTMDGLIHELIEYARMEKAPVMNPEITDIKSLLNERIAIRPETVTMIELVSGLPDVVLVLDYHFFCKVLDNLLQNACRYANSKVLIGYEMNENIFKLYVEDDGPGIPTDSVQNIFKPFVRLNPEETKPKGFGLGLAIAERMISWHHGSIVAEGSSQLGGAKFIVTLPAPK